MAEPVPQIHPLSTTAKDLIDSIKEKVDGKNAVLIGQPHLWGQQYGGINSLTDRLKNEFSKDYDVRFVAVSKFNKGTRLEKDTIIAALEPSIFTPRIGKPYTVDRGFFVYMEDDPSLSSSSDRSYVDAVVVLMQPKQ